MYTYTVEHQSISSHQLRAYGDTIYEGFLTFSVPHAQMSGSKWMQAPGSIEEVKQYIRLMATPFIDAPDPEKWFAPTLKKLEQVSPGRWHYRIERMYLD